MRFLSLKCPSCGASLTPEPGVHVADCTYCGSSLLWDRPSKPEERALPQVVVRPAPVVVAALAVLLLAGAGLGLAVFFVAAPQPASSPVASPPKGSQVLPSELQRVVDRAARAAAHPQWLGFGPALLIDVDGDGDREVLGRARYVNDGDRVVLAAADAASGAVLWESESLGTYSETYKGPLAWDGERFLFGDHAGGVKAIGPAGATLWSRTLGEAVTAFCPGPRAVSKAGGTLLLDAGTGEATPTREPCEPLAGDSRERWQGWASHGSPLVRGPKPPRDVPGMKARAALPRPDGQLLVGHREPGTRVPTLARWNGTVLWRTELPPSAPMASAEKEPALVQIDGDAVFAVVAMRSGAPPRVVRLDLASGTPVWESPLPDRLGTFVLTALTVGEGRVFVSTWGSIEVLDEATGDWLYALGASL